MTPHLIACVLGGTAAGARTELHDVAFAVGTALDDVHAQLLDQWLGNPRGLHVDAWCVLDSIAGHRVQLARTPSDSPLQLYFVNLGGYRANEFGERHACGFFATTGSADAKRQAKRHLLRDCGQVHKDDLYAVDDCLRIACVCGWHVHLQADPEAREPVINNGYCPLPASSIDTWLAGRAATTTNDEPPA